MTINYRLRRRSDSVVKGWILGSLSKETLTNVVDRVTRLHQERADFSAKDVWDELQTIYDPDVEDKPRDRGSRPTHLKMLYEAILKGSWDEVYVFLTEEEFELTTVDKIANNGNTALHVAVGNTKDHEFIGKLLEMTPQNTRLREVLNLDGSTLLHVAAMAGDVKVAEMLVERNPNLLLAWDNKDQIPLSIALLNVDDKMSQFLRSRMIFHRVWDIPFSSRRGDELLVVLVSSKKFGEANDWLELVTKMGCDGDIFVGDPNERIKHVKKRGYDSDAVLMAIAQNFPCQLNIFEKYIGTHHDIIRQRLKRVLKTAFDYMVKGCVPLCGSRVQRIFNIFNAGIEWIIMLFLQIVQFLVWPFIKERVQVYEDATTLLWNVCFVIEATQIISSHQRYYTNPILEGTRQNAYEVVHEIVRRFPDAIWSANEDGHNIIQYAVINRAENVYNVVYQMRKHKNIYKTIEDSSRNNLLHLAARLAPTARLNSISGAALQVQRELQWFKEVERFVSPLSILQKNSSGETPQMVFTREHKDLVIEGEKWMKATAESYTITAALITIIVFAAAITVPGGNNQDTGIPLFTNTTAFTIFAISDAISLFTAVTSLLIFLSILTTRFAEQDFLFKLPTKLIIGLTALFISTTAMIVAFSATLYLVFGQRNSKILISIVVLTCLPITSFVTLQFPLIIELMSATFGRSIFGKKRDEPFY